MGGEHEDALARLMRWYESQCDGEWEHEFGLKIESMDDPGWWVRIDLAYTGISRSDIRERIEHRAENDWIECRAEPGCVFTSDAQDCGHFVGMGGPHNLGEIIEYFLQLVPRTR